MNEDLKQLPISFLSDHAKYILSCLLNPQKLFLSYGLPRDWRGLAGLLEISSEVARNLNQKSDQTAEVLELWLQRRDSSAVIGKLLQFLQRLDRYDIYDDLVQFSISGLLVAKDKATNLVNIAPPSDNSEEFITYDDQMLGRPQMYHAYVLYAAEDEAFVREILARMKNYGYMLCTVHDVLPGYTTQYVPVSELLMKRCYRILAIYSESFFRNSANVFFINYAQAVSIEVAGHRKPKLIPCMYGDCERIRELMPRNIRYYFPLRYDPNDDKPVYDIWEKLYQTLHISGDADFPKIENGVVSKSEVQNSKHSFISDYVRRKLKLPLPGQASSSHTEFLTLSTANLSMANSGARKKTNTELLPVSSVPSSRSISDKLDALGAPPAMRPSGSDQSLLKTLRGYFGKKNFKLKKRKSKRREPLAVCE